MDTSLKLASGADMPLLGLGTWQVFDEKEIRRAVESALDSGYKLIDTARQYANENVIGQVLKERFSNGTLKRDDIFITSKVAMMYMGSKELVHRCVDKSLKDLQVDYIDLYLIHYPCGFKYLGDDIFVPLGNDGKPLMNMESDLIEVWKALEEYVDDGRIKSLGVSNFNISQMERILAIARHPVCNSQVELNVYFQQKELVEFCKKNQITVTAFAPLGSPGRSVKQRDGYSYPWLLQDDTVREIASRKRKTAAQIVMRFLIQQGIATIPKSVKPDRVLENSQLYDFVLSDDEMGALLKLDKNMRTFLLAMTKSHPEYPW